MPVIVRIVPPKGFSRVLGVRVATCRGTLITLAVFTGIRPLPSMTIGCQLPATAMTEQVIVYVSTIVGFEQAMLEKVICLIGEVKYWPVMVKVVPDREKSVIEAFGVT